MSDLSDIPDPKHWWKLPIDFYPELPPFETSYDFLDFVYKKLDRRLSHSYTWEIDPKSSDILALLISRFEDVMPNDYLKTRDGAYYARSMYIMVVEFLEGVCMDAARVGFLEGQEVASRTMRTAEIGTTGNEKMIRREVRREVVKELNDVVAKRYKIMTGKKLTRETEELYKALDEAVAGRADRPAKYAIDDFLRDRPNKLSAERRHKVYVAYMKHRSRKIRKIQDRRPKKGRR